MKTNKIPNGIKASIGFFLASFISSGISYLTTPIFTRMLSPEEFGRVSVYQTWLIILGIIAMFNYSGGVFNNGMIDYPKERDRFTFSILILSNITTIIFGVFFLSVHSLVSKYLNIPGSLMVTMLFVYLTQPAYNFWMARQRYEYKYKTSTLTAIFIALLAPISAIIALNLFDDNKVFWRIVGFTAPQIIVYLIIYFRIGNKAKWIIDKKYWKYCFLFNLPLIPHYLSTYVLNSSDKIMISYIVGDSEAAYYSLAYSVAAIASMIWTAINGSLIPFTYQKCKEEKYSDISRITIPLLVVFASGCFFVSMIAPEIVSFLGTKDYVDAIRVIPPVTGGVFFQVQYYIYANVLFYYKKTKFVMLASISSTILNLVLNSIFIPRFGYLAAGYTTLVSYLVQAVFDYFAMKHVLGKSIYNMKLIIGLSLIVIAVSLASSFLYSYLVIRYVLIILEIICLALSIKPIINIMKNIRGYKNESSNS